MTDLHLIDLVIYSQRSSRGSREHGFADFKAGEAPSIRWIVFGHTVPLTVCFLLPLYFTDPALLIDK